MILKDLLEAPSGFEPLNKGFADLSLSHLGTSPFIKKSERRDSNPRPQPWQGCALPAELLSLFDQYSQTFRKVYN